MGSIRLREESDTLFFDFRYRGVRCREQTVLGDTPANRSRMQKILDRIESEILAGTFVYAKYFANSPRAKQFADSAGQGGTLTTSMATPPARDVPTLAVFAEQFFREQSVGWRVGTRDWTRSIYDAHLIPKFGPLPVSQITREMVLEFRVELSEKRTRAGKPALKPKSINTIMRILGAIMTEASHRYHFTNPLTRIKRLKGKKADIFPFTLDEVKAIIQAIRPDYRPYVEVAFFTGMRPGELHGLKWEYVDFVRRQILVRETFTKGRMEYTKTDGSQREIQMSEPVYQALRAQEKVSRPVSDFVFCTRDGTPLHAKNLAERVWYPLLRHLGLRRRVPYQTRHTCATLWLGAGENPEWIARQLGHTTTEMLFRVYSRFVPNLTRKDGSAFEQLLASNALVPAAEPVHQA